MPLVTFEEEEKKPLVVFAEPEKKEEKLEKKSWWKKELRTAGEFAKFPFYTLPKEVLYPMYGGLATLPFDPKKGEAMIRRGGETGAEMGKQLGLGAYDWLRMMGLGTTPVEQQMARMKIEGRVKEHGVLAESIYPLLLTGAAGGLRARAAPKRLKAPEVTRILEKPKEVTIPPKEMPRNVQDMVNMLKREDAKTFETLQRTEPLPRTETEFLARLKRGREELRKVAKEKGIEKPPPEKPPVVKTPKEMPKTETQTAQDVSVQKVMQAIKEVKSVRKTQERLYSIERGKRLGRALGVGEKTKLRGEARFYAMKGKLAGELTKVEFESLRGKVSELDIQNVFDKAIESSNLAGFEKITAGEGLAKLFGEYGGRVPTYGELALLERVFPKEFIEVLLKKRPLMTKITEAGLQLANIPRAIMASFDLSFGLRQGAFAAPRFRKQFWNSWKRQFKEFGSERAYQASQEALVQNPFFELAKEARVAFTELGKILTKREEVFASQWAERIPIIGRGVRASGRAYTAFANRYRLDIFAELVKQAEKQGLKPRENPLITRKIADFVNNATGRSSLGAFEKASLGLNAVFFSPRLNVARIKLLWPGYYILQPKFVRQQALKTALSAAATATTILGVAKLGGLDVGANPFSADFGKIKVGDGRIRVDMLAGFSQFIRAVAQITSGKYISSVTGKEIPLGEGYRPITRKDILFRQIEAKEAPVFSLLSSILENKDWAGQELHIPKAVANRFIPMVWQDVYEIAKEDPEFMALGIPALFGVGLQVYESFPKEVKEFYGRSSVIRTKQIQYKKKEGVEKARFYAENKDVLKDYPKISGISRKIDKLAKKMRKTKESDLPSKIKEKQIANLERQMILEAKRGLKILELR